MENTKKTVRGILWEKFLVVLENSSFSEIFIFLFKCSIFVFFSAALVNIPKTLKLLKYAWFYNDFLLLKLFLVFVLVFFHKVFLKMFNLFKSRLVTFWENLPFLNVSADPLEKTFFGVPVYELADYIFENKTFKRDDVEAFFGLPRNRFDVMAKQMDAVKIFVRGENNGRVLNGDFSRSDVINILSSYDGVELRPLIRKVDNCTFVTAPSMPEILERSPLPSPG